MIRKEPDVVECEEFASFAGHLTLERVELFGSQFGLPQKFSQESWTELAVLRNG